MRLATRISEYAPSVVVLVARKAPRIREVLGLELSPHALVISDLAVPFCRQYMEGARVAVVDDVVNVGSTVRTAVRTAESLGAAEVRAFAISRLSRDQPLEGLDVEYVTPETLDPAGLAAFARRVPEALQALAKPYDLDFPLLRCRLRPPYASFEDLRAALEWREGESRVFDLSTPAGRNHGVHRLALDPPEGHERHSKVRIYLDERTGECVVMPIVVTGQLSTEEPTWLGGWPRGVWEQLAPLAPEGDGGDEARARIRLFVDSLQYGLEFLRRRRDLFLAEPGLPFAVEDAEMIFGPAVRRAVPSREANGGAWDSGPSGASPFLAAAHRHGLPDAVRSRLLGAPEPLSVFAACFEALADMVGAVEPSDFAMSDLADTDTVKSNPYLRLRIGPTIPDLTELVHEICGSPGPLEETRCQVTRMLDRFIDAGAVVPTIARYAIQDGAQPRHGVFRIYRKGEPPSRDPTVQRVVYAWAASSAVMSRTRASKMLSILELERQGSTGLEIRADARGTTACLPRSILGESIEIAGYLRDTGQVGTPPRADGDVGATDR